MLPCSWSQLQLAQPWTYTGCLWNKITSPKVTSGEQKWNLPSMSMLTFGPVPKVSSFSRHFMRGVSRFVFGGVITDFVLLPSAIPVYNRDRLSNGHHHNSLSYSCLSNALSVLEERVCGSTSHKRPLSQGSKLWSRQVGTGTMKTFSYYPFSVCWVLTGCWVSALSTAALFNTGAWLLPSSHAGLVGGRYCCFPSSSFWSLDWLWHCRWMWQCSAHSGSLKDSAWLGSSSPCMHYVSRKTSPSVAAWEVLG